MGIFLKNEPGEEFIVTIKMNNLACPFRTIFPSGRCWHGKHPGVRFLGYPKCNFKECPLSNKELKNE